MGFLNNFKEKQPERRAKLQAMSSEIKAKQQERRAEKEARKSDLAQSRGSELGHVPIVYKGGFDSQKRHSGKLRFYEGQIEYSQMGKPIKGLVIKAPDVLSIEIGGQQQTNSRISVTRMATLGIFSLAAPKRTTVKEATVIIGLKDGRQVLFHTKLLTEFEVHSKLANAISHYHRLQVTQADTHQAASEQPAPMDNAKEIMKYATLQKRGVITEEEFQAKKKQLLGL